MENTDNQNIKKLTRALEKAIEKEMGQPYEKLSVKARKRFLEKNMENRLEELRKEGGAKGKQAQYLSPYSYNTLQRLLGYSNEEHQPSEDTLKITALYLGFESFEDFIRKNTTQPKEVPQEAMEVAHSSKQAYKKIPFKTIMGAVILSMFGLFSLKNIMNILSNPIFLAGLVLLLFFGVHRLVVRSGLLQPLSKEDSSKALYLILQYGFYIALATIVLGLLLQGFRYTQGNQRADKAKRLVIKEILNNSQTLDTRLADIQFALGSLVHDDFNDTFKNTNQQLFPKEGSLLNQGYDKLILNERYNTVKQAVMSHPLKKEFGASLVDNIINSEPQVETWLFNYSNQLDQIEWSTKTLLNSINAVQPGAAFENHLALLNTNFQSLYQHTLIAHIYGLKVINEFDIETTEAINNQLQSLQLLKPQKLKPNKELDLLLLQPTQNLSEIIASKQDIVRKMEELRDSELDSLVEIVETLVVEDESDDMATVAGKAMSLRQFGRIEESITKFEELRRRFAPKEPQLNHYVDLAQQLSRQAKDLKIDRGFYIMSLEEDSPLKKAGFQMGDIIVEVNNNLAYNIYDYETGFTGVNTSENVDIVYLHLEASRVFSIKDARVTNMLEGVKLSGI